MGFKYEAIWIVTPEGICSIFKFEDSISQIHKNLCEIKVRRTEVCEVLLCPRESFLGEDGMKTLADLLVVLVAGACWLAVSLLRACEFDCLFNINVFVLLHENIIPILYL